jgi:hypothetical protein
MLSLLSELDEDFPFPYLGWVMIQRPLGRTGNWFSLAIKNSLVTRTVNLVRFRPVKDRAAQMGAHRSDGQKASIRLADEEDLSSLGPLISCAPAGIIQADKLVPGFLGYGIKAYANSSAASNKGKANG